MNVLAHSANEVYQPWRFSREIARSINMQTRAKVRLLAAIVLSAGPVAVLANGMRLGSQDSFASARGEAFVATADNPAAIYYNPAGLTQLDGRNVRAGIYGLYLDPSFTPPAEASNGGTTYHIRDQLAAVPQFFYSQTLKESRLSFGLGIYSPYGANVTWPQDTGFRAVAIEAELKYFRFCPVVALKLLPNLSLAAGALVDGASIELGQGLLRTEMPFVNFFRFQGDGWSLGYNVGLLWQPLEMLSLGATFRSSTEFTMRGHTEFEQQPIIPGTRQSAQADFEFPLTVTFGASFRPSPKWNFEFDADYTEWSSLGIVTIRQAAPPPFPVQQNIPVTLNWRPSWILEFGATRNFENDWHLSAGYLFNQNSVPESFYNPLAADLDRHFFSVGVGHKGKRLDFDVTYQFGYGTPHRVTGSMPSSQPGLFAGQTADGTYEFISHALFVTMGIRL